jgi:hypothetical protein
MVREEWLRKAVELLDSDLFGGGLDILNNNYQIACGWTKRNKVAEVIFPYDGADVQLDDLFPNTIHVSVTCQDTKEMLVNLAYACIQCFYGIRSTNSKKFKTLAESFYFDSPFSKCNPSQYLLEVIDNVYQKMVVRYGEFPGKAIVVRKKEKTKGQKRSLKLFCPDCSYEMTITRKMFEKHGNKLPTCVCGTKMALDLEDEDYENMTL